ncbi:hypothetical protein ACIHAA_03980 [Streptomyces sp. NPDC052040]|uniref:hypothetical protein n=1 Tax=unclassified Streptomyces TaxID=2593676 RepID=UPI0037D82AC6
MIRRLCVLTTAGAAIALSMPVSNAAADGLASPVQEATRDAGTAFGDLTGTNEVSKFHNDWIRNDVPGAKRTWFSYPNKGLEMTIGGGGSVSVGVANNINSDLLPYTTQAPLIVSPNAPFTVKNTGPQTTGNNDPVEGNEIAWQKDWGFGWSHATFTITCDRPGTGDLRLVDIRVGQVVNPGGGGSGLEMPERGVAAKQPYKITCGSPSQVNPAQNRYQPGQQVEASYELGAPVPPGDKWIGLYRRGAALEKESPIARIDISTPSGKVNFGSLETGLYELYAFSGNQALTDAAVVTVDKPCESLPSPWQC